MYLHLTKTGRAVRRFVWRGVFGLVLLSGIVWFGAVHAASARLDMYKRQPPISKSPAPLPGPPPALAVVSPEVLTRPPLEPQTAMPAPAVNPTPVVRYPVYVPVSNYRPSTPIIPQPSRFRSDPQPKPPAKPQPQPNRVHDRVADAARERAEQERKQVADTRAKEFAETRRRNAIKEAEEREQQTRSGRDNNNTAEEFEPCTEVYSGANDRPKTRGEASTEKIVATAGTVNKSAAEKEESLKATENIERGYGRLTLNR